MNLSKQELISIVAHDLKNPLSAVYAYAELLARQELPSRAMRHAKIIKNAAHHMTRMLDNLVALNALEAGTLKLLPSEFDPFSTAAAVLDSLSDLAAEKIIELRAQFESADQGELPVRVKMDEPWFKRGITALIENAIAHAPAGTAVTLGVRVLSDRVELTVTDDGPGIDPERIAHIFACNLSTAPNRHKGLSLFIVKSVLALSDGQIQVSSQLNHGSRFTITLPRALPTAAAAVSNTLASAGPQALHG